MNLRKMKKVISAAVSSAMLLTSLFTGFAPAISASAASGPDLIVTGITWSPSSPVTGNAVTFSCTVKNQGDTATPAGVVVGAQFQVDGTEVSWSDTDSTSLGAGSSVILTANSGPSGLATWNATSGTHTILAWVDDVNRIAESNENNNQYTQSLTVNSSGSTYPVPGKVEAENYSAMYGIQTETCSEGTLDVGYVDAGDWMDYSINVATAGTYEVDFRIAANSPTGTIQLQENSNVLATLTPQNTGGWQNWSTQSVNVTLPAGVQTLRVYSTGNGWNLNYLNFQQSSSQPDLIVTGITTSPSSPNSGDAVTFTATVENQGTAAGAPGTVAFSVDGTQVTTSSNNTTALAANSTTQMSGTTTWSATTGTHTILANVDCYNITTESNESNNTYTTSLTVSAQSQPDLIITGITTSPASPTAGDAVTFTATVKNQGTAAGAPGTVAFSVDGTQVSTSSNNTTPLAANSTTQMSGTTTWSATGGTHTILANVDINNITTESNESNNTYTTSLTVSSGGGLPDLIVTSISWSPTSPVTGNATTFSCVVKNQGTGATPAGTIVGVQFQVDGTEMNWSDTDTTSLGAGNTVILTANNGPSGYATWTATTGTHTILAWVDDVNRITESNENNNQYSTSLTVSTSSLPDLSVTNVTYSPTSPAAGNAVTFTATIYNGGSANLPSGTGFGVDFYLDGTKLNISGSSTSPINTGGSITVNSNGTWTATSGNHNVYAIVDPSNVVTESNESNNQSSTYGITVPGGSGQINWRVAPTKYTTNDVVVEGLNIQDFGVTGDGVTDVTSQFQAALNELGATDSTGTITGGTLFVPEGKYVIDGTLEIPKGVTLCGDWQKPVRGQAVKGTVLMAYSGAGNPGGTPFITIQPNAEVRDINIWYPNQDPNNIAAYPATIRMNDPNVWGADAAWVQDVTFVNSYFAIQQGPAGNGCTNIENVYGTALDQGMNIDNSSDVDKMENIDFSPAYWAGSGLPGSPSVGGAYATWMKQNGTGITLGRIDWSYLSFATCDGYNRGLYFELSPTNANDYPDGQCYGLTFTNCNTAIEDQGTAREAEQLTNLSISGCGTGINIENNSNDTGEVLQVYSADISASSYAINNQGYGILLFSQGTIESGTIHSNNGNITVVGSTIKTAAPQIVLDSGASEAIVTGNTFTYSANVQNNGSCRLVYDTAASNLPAIPTFPSTAVSGYLPAKTTLYVVSADPTNTTDATPAIQSALTAAGNNGGGIVFVPPGQYKINGTLNVPNGVELKGAVDIGRMPIKLGTIFDVYYGMGNGNATPIVTLNTGSGIRGIVFDEPSQNYDTPVAYPYCVRGNGSNEYIVDVSFANVYNGVDLFTNRCDNHYVDYLAGAVLNNAIRVGGGSVGGHVYNYQFNYGPIVNGAETKWGCWDDAVPSGEVDQYSTSLDQYLETNADIAIYGNCSGEIIYNNFSIFARKGVYLMQENGTGPSGWVLGQGNDWSRQDIYIDNVGSGGMNFINTQGVAVNKWGFGDSAFITLASTCTNTVNFFGTAFWAQPDNDVIVKRRYT